MVFIFFIDIIILSLVVLSFVSCIDILSDLNPLFVHISKSTYAPSPTISRIFLKNCPIDNGRLCIWFLMILPPNTLIENRKGILHSISQEFIFFDEFGVKLIQG